MRGLGRLFRLPLSIMNGMAALGGYLLYSSPVDTVAPGAVFAGVTLMACAASASNQVLERDLDALMRRTGNRPLPSGELAPTGALLISLASLLTGGLLLEGWGGTLPLVLALATLLWYLLVYTPLKRRTPFALLLGALCGAVPPLIGWSAAGGGLADYRIVLLAGIMYLWQVPHFWMLQRRHAEDYRLAGLPLFVPQSFQGPAPLLRLWMAAMVMGTLMLPAFGLIGGQNAPFWCLAFCAPLLLAPFQRWEPATFVGVNLFPALITLALYATH